MTDKYDDIINLPHKQSDTRHHMKPEDRAAQFAPFAALVGYGDAIDETIRLTDSKLNLSEDAVDALNQKLAFLSERLSEEPIVSVTYFVPDQKKKGGAYRTAIGIIADIEEYERVIKMSDRTIIPITDVYQITGDCFRFLEYP